MNKELRKSRQSKFKTEPELQSINLGRHEEGKSTSLERKK
jgi:hypothetical protein